MKETIDWQSTVERLNNSEDLAQELLDMFIEECQKILTELDSSINASTKMNLHKLRGSSCYINTPKLKAILDKVDPLELETDSTKINSYVPAIKEEIQNIIDCYEAKTYCE